MRVIAAHPATSALAQCHQVSPSRSCAPGVTKGSRVCGQRHYMQHGSKGMRQQDPRFNLVCSMGGHSHAYRTRLAARHLSGGSTASSACLKSRPESCDQQVGLRGRLQRSRVRATEATRRPGSHRKRLSRRSSTRPGGASQVRRCSSWRACTTRVLQLLSPGPSCAGMGRPHTSTSTGDLYVSTFTALDWVFTHGLARVGTVLGFDDWWNVPCASSDMQRDGAHIATVGGEPEALLQAASKHSVWVECICGACSAADAADGRGWRTYFIVRSLAAAHPPEPNFGLAPHDARAFLRKSNRCRDAWAQARRGEVVRGTMS